SLRSAIRLVVAISPSRLGYLGAPPSFPTRRSSDLGRARGRGRPGDDRGLPGRYRGQRRGGGGADGCNLGGREARDEQLAGDELGDRKSTRLNSSHVKISYAVFRLKKKKRG